MQDRAHEVSHSTKSIPRRTTRLQIGMNLEDFFFPFVEYGMNLRTTLWGFIFQRLADIVSEHWGVDLDSIDS